MEAALQFGLPVLLMVIGVGVWLWGRRQQEAARAQIGQKGGFGGPPGTLDIGTEIGFGVEGPGPDPAAARPKIIGGLVLVVVGLVLLIVMALINLV